MRTRSLWTAAVAGVLGATAAIAVADGEAQDERTTVTIWRTPSGAVPAYAAAPYGGVGYGGVPAGDAAFVSHRRAVEVVAAGELRFPGVSTRIDPSTVQFRSLTDARGTQVVEQRYAYDLGSPEKLIRRHLGKPVTVTTSRGEISGVLRGIDADSLVLESGSGAQRAVEIIRRGGHLLDVRLAAGDDALATVPTLVWKVIAGKPGRQRVEVSYRTAGLRWDADYTAILDEGRGGVDLSAWATVANETGVTFREAELVLVTGLLEQPAPVVPYQGAFVPRTPSVPPRSFTAPRPVTIAAGGTVQVELMPAQRGMASRRVLLYETMQDMSPSFQAYPHVECAVGAFGQPQSAGGRGELAIEIDPPGKGVVLPEGRVRVFQRKADAIELLGEDALKVNAATGQARFRLGGDDGVQATRRQVECRFDDRTRSLREKVEIKVENRRKEPVEVVLREHLYRWVSWKLEAEDVTGTRAAPQTQEYRIKLGPSGKKTFTYTVVYAW
jgi:hypothetical protein